MYIKQMSDASNGSLGFGLPALALNRSRRHVNYISVGYKLNCWRPSGFIEEMDDDCTFIRKTPACNDFVQQKDYLELMICTWQLDKAESKLKIMAITLLMLSVYLLIMFMVGRFFIIPNVVTLFNHVKLNSFEFGLIVLGTVVAIPEFLFEVTVCNNISRSPEMILSMSMGRTISQFVAGIIILSCKRHLSLNPHIVVRYMVIVLLGNVYTIEVFSNRMLEDNQGIPNPVNMEFHCAICLIAYFLCLYGTLFVQCWDTCTERRPSITVDDDPYEERRSTRGTIEEPGSLQPNVFRMSSITTPENADNDTEKNVGIQSNDYEIDEGMSVWTVLGRSLNPYENMQGYNCLFITFVIPLWILGTLVIPVIDRKRPLHGWCKYMVCFSYVAYVLIYIFSRLPQRYTVVVAIFFLLLLYITLSRTSISKLPKYFYLYTIPSMMIGNTIFFILNHEITALTHQVFTFVAHWKDDSMALFGLQLSNIFAECILTIALVQIGLYEMAFGAIIGVLLFSTFTAMPSSILGICIQDEPIGISANTISAYVFLIVIYTSMLIGISFTNFEIRFTHGIYILVMYTLFLFFLRSSGDFLHPYGAQHSSRVVYDTNHASWA